MSKPVYRRPRRGFLLLMVLVTIMALTLAAWSFTLLMVSEDMVTALSGRQIQARYLVESGVDYTRMILASSEADIQELGGVWQNPGLFQSQPVSVNPLNTEEIGYFSIVAPSLNAAGNFDGFRFGLVDESSKLNLNTLVHAERWVPDGGRQLLMALPLMTTEIADAIMDYLDEDDDPRDYGVEYAWYASQQPPYQCKNGPLDTIEELLQVKGITPHHLFGLDTNRNGILDLDEKYAKDAPNLPPEMLLGWANYMTLFSKESNRNPSGLERININNEDLDQLYDDLRSVFNEEWSNFIIAYRQNGPYSGEIDPEKETDYVDVDTSLEAKFTFTQLIDLIDATTGVETENEEGETVTMIFRSPVNSLNLGQTLPVVMQNLTTVSGDNIPGRINIMQAPRPVLLGIPGMTEQIADEIIRVREQELNDPGLTDMHRRYETWILLERIVDLPTMKVMTPFICARGHVFQCEVVGYFQDGVATSRAEVILDMTQPVPRTLFWRDKSHLQSGHSVDVLGVGLR